MSLLSGGDIYREEKKAAALSCLVHAGSLSKGDGKTERLSLDHGFVLVFAAGVHNGPGGVGAQGRCSNGDLSEQSCRSSPCCTELSGAGQSIAIAFCVLPALRNADGACFLRLRAEV